MGNVFLHGKGGAGGGGSGGLELTVVGGATRPAKPTQNMIWVNTPNEITSCALSAVQPDAPVEGMLWLKIADSGSIKVPSPVGGDWITVYPLSVEQYVDGAWAGINAMSYQNGEWVEWWNGELFKDGTSYLGELYTSTPTYLYVENGELKFIASGENGSWGYWTEQVDLSKFTKLKAKMKQTAYGSTAYGGILSVTTTTPSSTGPINVKNRSAAYVQITVKDGVVHELETSVATLSGLHYVEFAAVASGAIVEAWFE